MVLSHIESLPENTRISVRELAAQLQVSEGTAYKAVKEAEQRGLVRIKPKAGTVRVKAEQPAFENAVSAAELVRLMGLSVVSGKEKLARQIRKLVICDGSEQSLLHQLAGAEAAACLCLCGDRPALQAAVLEHARAASSWVLPQKASSAHSSCSAWASSLADGSRLPTALPA